MIRDAKQKKKKGGAKFGPTTIVTIPSAKRYVDAIIKHRPFVMFSKTYSPQSLASKRIMDNYPKLTDDVVTIVQIEKRGDCDQMETYLLGLSGMDRREVPLLFVNGRCMGGYKDIMLMDRQKTFNGLIERTLNPPPPEADFDDPINKCVEVGIKDLQPPNLDFKIRIEEYDVKSSGDPNKLTEEQASTVNEMVYGAKTVRRVMSTKDMTYKLGQPHCDIFAVITELKDTNKRDKKREEDEQLAKFGSTNKNLGLKALRLNFLTHRMSEVSLKYNNTDDVTIVDDKDSDLGREEYPRRGSFKQHNIATLKFDKMKKI